MTSVVIADDQELVRSGFRMILEARGLDVLGEAADGREAVSQVRELRPDVVLMDVRMPVLDGIAATRELVAAGAPTRVLVLTTYDEDEVVYRALAAGASGFLLKAARPDQLVDGVLAVAAGDSLLAPAVTRRLIQQYVAGPPPGAGATTHFAALTPRELEVVKLIAGGHSNRDIAERFVVSEATVKTHVNRILAKLDAHDRVQIVVRAYETGLVRPGAG